MESPTRRRGEPSSRTLATTRKSCLYGRSATAVPRLVRRPALAGIARAEVYLEHVVARRLLALALVLGGLVESQPVLIVVDEEYVLALGPRNEHGVLDLLHISIPGVHNGEVVDPGDLPAVLRLRRQIGHAQFDHAVVDRVAEMHDDLLLRSSILLDREDGVTPI